MTRGKKSDLDAKSIVVYLRLNDDGKTSLNFVVDEGWTTFWQPHACPEGWRGKISLPVGVVVPFRRRCLRSLMSSTWRGFYGSTNCATLRAFWFVTSTSKTGIPWNSNISSRRYCSMLSTSCSFAMTLLSSSSTRVCSFSFSFQTLCSLCSLINLITWSKFVLIKSRLFLISSTFSYIIYSALSSEQWAGQAVVEGGDLLALQSFRAISLETPYCFHSQFPRFPLNKDFLLLSRRVI